MTAWDGLIEHGWVQYFSRVGIMYSWAHSQIYWCSGMSVTVRRWLTYDGHRHKPWGGLLVGSLGVRSPLRLVHNYKK
jgi:hypothetical protein